MVNYRIDSVIPEKKKAPVMSKKPTDAELEALNSKLLMALVTLTSTFIMVAFGLYFLLGR